MALTTRTVRDLVIGVAATAGVLLLLRLQMGGNTPIEATPATPDLPRGAPTPLEPPAASDAVAIPPLTSGEISVLALLGEMADLGHLARLPEPRFVAGQAASTDKRSRRPEEPEGWFANDDFVTETAANLVRVETHADGSKRYVLLDATGPGAVVRLWTATPAGTLRIYVDDDPRPVVEAPTADLLSGRVAPFYAPLAHVVARGYNLYFPFPYAKRCVITVDTIVSPDPFTGRPIAKLYHQIGYRTYAPAAATRVRPASATELARARDAILRVAVALREGDPAPTPGDLRVAAIPTAPVSAERPSVTRLSAPQGGGSITELALVVRERAPDKLRATWLAISFDGEETVRAPLVDFFGTGPGLAPYRALPMVVSSDGALVCRFPMPFRKRAVITLSRTGAGSVEVGGKVSVAATPFDDRSMLFHARWHPRELLPTRPYRDWRVDTLAGEGWLVGMVLDVENPPGTGWWGEGDEKIRVDGETFPSWFGTGTEDYFGYAWSATETFAHAYHAQTRAPAGGFPGLWSMNRFHVLDPIPFTRSLVFDLEIWHWSATTLALDATLYWYARTTSRSGP